MHPLLIAVKSRIGTDAFSQWFTHAEILEADAEVCTIQVPNSIHQLWIETNFQDVLRSSLFEVTEAAPEITFVVREGEEEEPDKQPFAAPVVSTKDMVEAAATGTEPRPADRDPLTEKQAKKHKLNSAFTFDQFVEGSNSRFAIAAAKAVAEDRALGYSPLFLYGASGLGKTHILHAIGLERLRRDPRAKVIYITSEEFANEYIAAIQNKSLEKLRAKYRSADLFLLDDVQFLAGKDRTQEEFFHTFNSLFDSQCQIVLSADCPASAIKGMSDRLISRFEAGMTTEVVAPRLETREAIIRHRISSWKVNLAPEVIGFLANRIDGNVRRLVGALVRLSTYTALGEGFVSTARAEELLHDIIAEDSLKMVNIDRIQKTVAETHDMILADMSSRRRPAHIAFPRQIAMYLSRKMTNSSLVQIGQQFGGRDHGTVLHAVRRVEAKMRSDVSVKDLVEKLADKLQR